MNIKVAGRVAAFDEDIRAVKDGDPFVRGGGGSQRKGARSEPGKLEPVYKIVSVI